MGYQARECQDQSEPSIYLPPLRCTRSLLVENIKFIIYKFTFLFSNQKLPRLIFFIRFIQKHRDCRRNSDLETASIYIHRQTEHHQLLQPKLKEGGGGSCSSSKHTLLTAVTTGARGRRRRSGSSQATYYYYYY